MSTTPTTFTITESGTYRTTDGRAAYWFEAGTIIPMYLAIALGIEGAGYVASPVFNSDQTAAINELINASGGGGGGASFPMAEGVWYDNRTAVGGERRNSVDLDVDSVAVAVIQVTAEDVSIIALSVNVTDPPENAVTIRAAVYEIDAGLTLGDRIGAEGSVAVESSETGDKTITLAAATPPGYYAIALTSTEWLGVQAFGNTGDYVFPPVSMGFDDLNGDPYTGYQAEVTGAHTDLPSSLSSVTASDLNSSAPFVYFQITHT